ncbi:MAG: single-stranded DNA-binding protein [Anaerolineae bacterium]|jgi:single-strand DNA-binding protein|nr:single-stranded DNA-binding protein [Anaerolineae bacterium]
MYHKVTIVGHLGRDPEMRYTPDGTPVTDFSVATSRKWNNPDGSKGEETVWFRVTVWRRQAETVAQYLRKGSLVLVEGRLNPDKNGSPRVWTGQDGTPRASFEITADTVRFMGGKSDGEGRAGVAEPDTSYDGGEDLPF